jgi:archaeosine-15-forming tRNA-guanine transglycosylase
MEIVLGVVGVFLIGVLLVVLFEYRVRQPDFIVLYESDGQIGIRKGALYPRHFSLPLKRTTCPLQLTIEAAATGNLLVRIKLIGSAVPSVNHIQALVRVGGWDSEAVSRAVEQVRILLQGLIKEYTEHSEIHAISSPAILDHLNQQMELVEERFGIELIALAVESLEPVDPEVASALSQQEEARLLEQTERLSNHARIAAAKAKYEADEEIAAMEHALDMRRTELKKIQFQSDAELAKQRVEAELARSRQRLAFEKEELDILRESPELLMLTPQAAQLAEASQNLKNARTVISLSPHEIANGASLFTVFRSLLEKELAAKKDAAQPEEQR